MEAPEFNTPASLTSDLKTPDPARALNLGVGLASPLWPAFVATAGAGLAFWWMARWIQVEDRSFAPADPSFPLGPPAELTNAVEQAYAEPMEATFEAAEEIRTVAVDATQEAVAQTAAATEAVLDQTTETAEAVADHSVAVADAVAEQSLQAADAAAETVETATEQAAEVVAAPVKASRARRDRPVE